MPTHTETLPFTAAWNEWHAARERHRADPHGFLAVTHLHWLRNGICVRGSNYPAAKQRDPRPPKPGDTGSNGT
jgi:uncharacterized protein (DUF1684 family)